MRQPDTQMTGRNIFLFHQEYLTFISKKDIGNIRCAWKIKKSIVYSFLSIFF
jgi:hypothetical protein